MLVWSEMDGFYVFDEFQKNGFFKVAKHPDEVMNKVNKKQHISAINTYNIEQFIPYVLKHIDDFSWKPLIKSF